MLPKPNLEYDRKQAKRLFKACQQADLFALDRLRHHLPRYERMPDDALIHKVTLADAQHVIAREAGFASWAKLKQHIEAQTAKMLIEAFKTAVSTPDPVALNKLLRRYPSLRRQINGPHFAFDSPAIVVANKNQALTEVLLKHGADPNVKTEWEHGGFGALHHAAPEVVTTLLAHGATLDIHAAAELERFEDVERLLKANPHRVDAPGGDGKRPLHFARSIAMQDLLLAHGATIDQRDSDHLSTPAQHKVGQPALCRHLLANGATPDIFMAVALGDLPLIEQLAAADPNGLAARIGDGSYKHVPDAPGLHIYFYEMGGNYMPHMVALLKGKTAVLELLLAHSKPKERFLIACWQGDAEKAKALLSQHPTLLQTLRQVDQRQLADTAWINHIAAVRTMLALGFDPQVYSDHNSTPLDRAAFHGFAEMVELLLAHDPPLRHKNEFGSTPLETAVYGQTHSWRKDGDFERTITLLEAAQAN